MRDGFIGARASISTQFLNGVTTPPVNTELLHRSFGNRARSGAIVRGGGSR